MPNRSLSNRIDEFIAYLVGEQRTSAAVACALEVEQLKRQGDYKKGMLEGRSERECTLGGPCSPVTCTSPTPCAFYSNGPHSGKSGNDLFEQGKNLWKGARAAMMFKAGQGVV